MSSRGELLGLHARSALVRNSNGQIGASAAIFYDAKLELRCEEGLQQAKMAAEQASFAKTACLANCLHEIRTPRSTIMGFVDLLRGGGSSPAEEKGFLDATSRSCNDISAIINDFFDVSLVESGQVKIVMAEFSVRDLLEEVMAILQIKIKEKGIEPLTNFVDGVSDSIIRNSGRIKQILLNVIGNAIKFTKQGNVHVTVQGMPNGQLAFVVKDTGIGIPKESASSFFAYSRSSSRSATAVRQAMAWA